MQFWERLPEWSRWGTPDTDDIARTFEEGTRPMAALWTGIAGNLVSTVIGFIPLILQSAAASGVINTTAAPGWITAGVIAALGAVSHDVFGKTSATK
jgi:hypothetical protein